MLFIVSGKCFSEGKKEVLLENGNIVVKSDSGKKVLEYNNSKNKYSKYNDLKKWQVSTIVSEQDKVNNALAIFKKKTQENSEKAWIIARKDGSQQIIIEDFYGDFNDNDSDDQIGLLFSQDENFVFFKGLGDNGEGVVFCMDLNTQKKFVADNIAEDDFNPYSQDSVYISEIDENGDEKDFIIYNNNKEK